MIKLKDLLEGKNYNSPGYENRGFGDPLPTLEDITKKYQEGKEDVNEEETINEAPEQQMASQLNKVSDTILKITNKFKGKADVDGMTRSWMMGLHAKLKKAGIKTWLA